MSKANETNQTKPNFQIKGCWDCPALSKCTVGNWTNCPVRIKIEKLVNNN